MSKFTSAMRKVGSATVHTDLADIGQGTARLVSRPAKATSRGLKDARQAYQMVKTMRQVMNGVENGSIVIDTTIFESNVPVVTATETPALEEVK